MKNVDRAILAEQKRGALLILNDAVKRAQDYGLGLEGTLRFSNGSSIITISIDSE